MANQIIAVPRYLMTILDSSTSPASLQAENLLEPGVKTNVWRATDEEGYVEGQFDKPEQAGIVTLAGIRTEGAHRNLLTESTDLEHADWVPLSAFTVPSITLGPGPFGEYVVYAISLSASAHTVQAHFLMQAIANRQTEIQQYTLSAYVKSPGGASGTNPYLMLHSGLASGGTWAEARFEVSGAGSVISTDDTGTWVVNSTSIELVDNDWYRISLTATSDALSLATARLGILDSTDGLTFDEVEYPRRCDFVNPQVELGDTVTEYVPVDQTAGDVPATLCRWIQATTQAKLTATPEYDSGMIHVAMGSGDFRDLRSIHVHHILDEQYKFWRLETYAQDQTDLDIGRLIVDNPWIAPVVPLVGVDLMANTMADFLQESDSGALWIINESRRRQIDYTIMMLTDSEAYDRYFELSRLSGSSGEIYMVLDSAGTDTIQEESIFGIPTWSPMRSVSGAGYWRGSLTLDEWE